MDIKGLLEQIEYISFSGDDNVELKGITNDSRKVSHGDIFVAIKGFTADGHEYIKDAL